MLQGLEPMALHWPRNRGRVGRTTRDQLADLGRRLFGPLRQQHAGLIPHRWAQVPHGIAELVPNQIQELGEKTLDIRNLEKIMSSIPGYFCLKKLLKRILKTWKRSWVWYLAVPYSLWMFMVGASIVNGNYNINSIQISRSMGCRVGSKRYLGITLSLCLTQTPTMCGWTGEKHGKTAVDGIINQHI